MEKRVTVDCGWDNATIWQDQETGFWFWHYHSERAKVAGPFQRGEDAYENIRGKSDTESEYMPRFEELSTARCETLKGVPYRAGPIAAAVVRALTGTDKRIPEVCWAVFITYGRGDQIARSNDYGGYHIYTIRDSALSVCDALNED